MGTTGTKTKISMKKFLAKFLLSAVLITSAAFNARAERSFTIAGQKILPGQTWTPATHTFLRSTCYSNGQISLSADGKTLTLSDVEINAPSGKIGIQAYADDNWNDVPGSNISIKVKGRCEINTNGAAGIEVKAPEKDLAKASLHVGTSATGSNCNPHKLIINAQNGNGVYLYSRKFFMAGYTSDGVGFAYISFAVNTEIYAGANGIRGRQNAARTGSDPCEKVQVSAGKYLYIAPTPDGAIYQVKSIAGLGNVGYPVGIAHQGGALQLNGSLYKGEVVAGPILTAINISPSQLDLDANGSDYINVSPVPADAFLDASFVHASNAITPSNKKQLSVKITAATDYGTSNVYIRSRHFPNVQTISYPVNISGIWVAGVMVNPNNEGNILQNAPTGNTGTVSYSHSTKTLTLDNATIVSDYYRGADNYSCIEIPQNISSFNINAVGTNTIYNKRASYNINGITSSSGTLNINGSGTLNIKTHASNKGTGISGKKIVIDHPDVKISDVKNGIQAYQGSVVLNKSIEITSSEYAVGVGKGMSLTIGNQSVYEGNAAPGTPVNRITMYLNSNQYYDITKKYLKISASGTGLESLASQGIQVWGGKGEIHIKLAELVEANTVNVYDLSGALVRSIPLSGGEAFLPVYVPSGIYIVRIGDAAEKVVVK